MGVGGGVLVGSGVGATPSGVATCGVGVGTGSGGSLGAIASLPPDEEQAASETARTKRTAARRDLWSGLMSTARYTVRFRLPAVPPMAFTALGR